MCEYIRAGDIFQVVPSQRLTVQTDVESFEIYRSLRVVNPSPFMFFVRTETASWWAVHRDHVSRCR